MYIKMTERDNLNLAIYMRSQPFSIAYDYTPMTMVTEPSNSDQIVGEWVDYPCLEGSFVCTFSWNEDKYGVKICAKVSELFAVFSIPNDVAINLQGFLFDQLNKTSVVLHHFESKIDKHVGTRRINSPSLPHHSEEEVLNLMWRKYNVFNKNGS